MKALKLCLLAAAGSLALAGAAQAQDEPAFKPAFNIGVQSDYVFRGFSQTDEDPSVFGGVDLTLGSIGYVGVWASNVDFGNGTDAEVDVYAGIKPALGPVTLDLGVIYYGYIDSPSGSGQAYWEGKVAASFAAGPATLGVAAYYSPDFFGSVDDALYYEANAAIPIPNSKFSVSGAIGRQELEGPGDYTVWNAGVGFALTDHVGIDVRYWDTDFKSSISDSRVVAGVKLTF